MRCLPFFHKWPSLPEVEVLDVDHATAMMIGNVIVSYRCLRCGAVKSRVKYLPRRVLKDTSHAK
jgi:hypothetical protein